LQIVRNLAVLIGFQLPPAFSVGELSMIITPISTERAGLFSIQGFSKSLKNTDEHELGKIAGG
jgi:hypothetical protein